MFLMILSITNLWSSLFDKKKNVQEAIEYGDCYLPSARSNEALDDNRVYMESITTQIEHVSSLIDMNSKTKVLDFGCGQGRLANGLIFNGSEVERLYGVDTHKASITWCNKWISKNNENYQFIHLSAKNERYNPAADSLKLLPFEDNYFDLTFLNSVFSHMMEYDVRFYLAELYRVMDINGLIYLTAFIEDSVKNVEENPDGYLGKKSKGALHRVRYERSFFTKMLEDAGFVDISIRYRGIERTMQSVVTARKQRGS